MQLYEDASREAPTVLTIFKTTLVYKELFHTQWQCIYFFHNRGKAKGPAAAQMWTNNVYLIDGASAQKWKQTISKLTER